MKHLPRILPLIIILTLLLSLASFASPAFANEGQNGDHAPDRLIVGFQPGTSASDMARVHQQVGGKVEAVIPQIRAQVVTVPAGQQSSKLSAYRTHREVRYVEPDYVAHVVDVPNDSYFDEQWGMNKVEAPQAWDVTTGSASVNIAILDTGIDLDHPDLAAKIVSSINFTDSPSADDNYGHGTHCAGIAAAITNNGIGVAGLGYSSSIMNVKVLGDDGTGYWSWVAEGIISAADNGANIINLSLGDSSASSAVEEAIDYAWNKGVVVVAAAGNNGNSDAFYPAYYTNCIAVAATAANDALASWSNYGSWVDVAAPGTSIYSTFEGGFYGYMSGTSMASPHVAGLAALVLTTVSDINGDGKLKDEVRTCIEATCDDIGLSGIGNGRINAFKAVQASPLPSNQPPVLDPIANQTVDEGQLLQFSISASDPDGDALTYSASNLPPGASFEARTFSWTPDYSQAGIYQLTFVTSDGELSDSESSTITVNDVVRTGHISGVVTDAADSSPIGGATVSDGTRSAMTDASGNYAISDVPEGSYTVTCSKDGYETSSMSVTVVSGETTTASFALAKAPPPTTKSMWVDSITFSTRGKNLCIEVKVVSDAGAVAGASVELKLENGEQSWNFSGTADSEGRVRFMLNKAPVGDYLATITGLVCQGYDWDKNKGITSAGYTLSTGNNKANQNSNKSP